MKTSIKEETIDHETEHEKLIKQTLNWLVEITDVKYTDENEEEIKNEENKENKSLILNLNDYCKKYHVSASERGRLTSFFGTMRDKFDIKQELLESNGTVSGDASEKFEQSKQLLRSEDPPLFYIVYSQKQWLIPTYEKKYNTLEKSFNKDAYKLLNNIKEMAKYNEYILKVSNLSAESLVEKAKLLQSIVDFGQRVVYYCQMTVGTCNNRIQELLIKNAKISRVYNDKITNQITIATSTKVEQQPDKELLPNSTQNGEGSTEGIEEEKFATEKECILCKSNNITELLYTDNGIRCKCDECGDIFVVKHRESQVENCTQEGQTI